MSTGAIILILAGLFLTVGAILDQDWFMDRRRTRFATEALGSRQRARVAYIVVGLGALAAGVLAALGVINLG